MATTDSNGIVFLEETDPISPFHTTMNVLQQGTSDALDSLKNGDLDAVVIHPVANTAARGSLATAYGPTAAKPLYVDRQDAPAYAKIERTTDGTTWTTVITSGGPLGVVAYAKGPSSTTNVGTTPVNITSLTFSAVAGRRYEITVAVEGSMLAAGTGKVQMSGSGVAGWPTDFLWWKASSAAEALYGVNGTYDYTPATSGSVTINITCDSQGGGQMQIPANKARLWIKDIGAA